MAGSARCTAARVSGARHQSWTRTRASGFSIIHSCAIAAAGWLPPWPLTIRIRRKPLPLRLSSTSRSSAVKVATRSVTVPGKPLKYGVRP
jgi:hypothetical protein